MATPAVPQLVEVTVEEPVIVAPTSRRARIKGTWTQYYGSQRYDFIDGQSYDLSQELFDYLRSRGNIYDTLA